MQSAAPQLKEFLSDFGENPPADKFAEMDLLDVARGGFGICFDKTGRAVSIFPHGQVMKIMTFIEGRFHSACPSKATDVQCSRSWGSQAQAVRKMSAAARGIASTTKITAYT
jgi:hypothetical protein